ncbi:hypothetical protein ACSBR1_037254 [Camellia fascicularis]
MVVWSKSIAFHLYNAIVWMDVRTSSICSSCIQTHSSSLLRWFFVASPALRCFAGSSLLRWLSSVASRLFAFKYLSLPIKFSVSPSSQPHPKPLPNPTWKFSLLFSHLLIELINKSNIFWR